jgi:hypothetical protein
MPRVFLCYSRKDSTFAHSLAADLDRLGADVWIDVDDIRSGDDWSDTIQRALDDCQVLVLILSPDAVASANVSNEWKYFLDNHKPVIPIWFRPASVHFRLKPLHYVDFNTRLYDTAFKHLYQELVNKGVTLAPLSALRDEPTRLSITVPAARRTWLHRPREHRPHRTRHTPTLAAILGAVLIVLGVSGAAWSISAVALGSDDTPTSTHTAHRPPATLGAHAAIIESPTPTPPADHDLRLVYDRYEMVLVNTSGAVLDVSDLVFEQALGDGASRTFEARLWDRPGMVRRPNAMPPNGCFQILTDDARQVPPNPAICPKFLGYFSTGLSRRQFWIAAGEGATFSVRQADEATPLAECNISAGACGVDLP